MPKKTRTTNVKGKSLSPAQFKKRQSVKAIKVKRISTVNLSKIVSELSGRTGPDLGTPVMELNAQHPFDELGLMDVLQPGRWDCTSNLVFMETIVVGKSAGEWEGTVAYVNFKAPQNGSYIVVGNFTGYQVTMQLIGPWGTNTAYTPTTSSSGTVVALWNGTANQKLYFNINCLGKNNKLGMGYLESVQVFLLQ